ncbi:MULTISPECIES: hypothetical protein [unclassified Bradyrhizobium]|uniref:Nmad2 family putative nucleotide modification protein n=1 Tax=unclassified Bradyrhizobium TaxID=2631580 RepID=UPI0028EE377D|nr:MULTISPECIES: hypothetical protein [unclassified Bradyrhizobium]
MPLHTYIVRYDSGFAPNPFYGFCTLATCKPKIRKYATIGDWLLGTGSGEKKIGRAGTLVYAMRITEALSFDEYDADARFLKKKPYRTGSRKQSCGDNIYFRETSPGPWKQRDSFHSLPDGRPNPKHIGRDTSVNRVLISDHFIYFGGDGPSVPTGLKDRRGRGIVHASVGQSRFDDPHLLEEFELWIQSLGNLGYRSPPYEWLDLRTKT